MTEMLDLADLDFDSLELTEVPVKLGGKKYILKEASIEAHRLYTNKAVGSTKLSKDGTVTSIVGAADIQPYLVSLCLFYEGGDGKHHPVSEQVIKSWPSRVGKKLFQAIKQISDFKDEDDSRESLLRQKAEIEAKLAALDKDPLGNGQDSTTE